jgi:hypothetical protein
VSAEDIFFLPLGIMAITALICLLIDVVRGACWMLQGPIDQTDAPDYDFLPGAITYVPAPNAKPIPLACAGCGAPLDSSTCSYCRRSHAHD